MICRELDLHDSGSSVSLALSFDGLPLFRSSNKTWPVFGNIYNIERAKPFVIGLFCGIGKPENCHQFPQDLVEECEELSRDGFWFNNKQYALDLSGPLVADTPARAYVKQTKRHAEYFACERCEQERNTVDSLMTFPETTARLRTDRSFLAKEQLEHQGTSPLATLRTGMVTQFVLDCMHLVCLGVRKLLIRLLLLGPKQVRVGWATKDVVSNGLLAQAPGTPFEFAKKPRSLNELDRWKTTELLDFLLYTGPVVLKNVVHPSAYKHFFLLHCGITIFASPRCHELFDAASEFLRTFVMHFPKVYGPKYISLNVHSLIHLKEDVRRYSRLGKYRAFPFENYMQSLKQMVR